MNRSRTMAALTAAALLFTASTSAQWNHRYPKLSDFGHHVYLEEHELPALTHGPRDPAPAPDGRRVAFAAQGWLWVLDLESGVATRLTDGSALDARPRWSPDGSRMAFVRDTGRDTAIVVLDLESGEETLINSLVLELDPEFSTDGESLFYSAGVGDVLSLWRRHLASGAEFQLTDLPQVERNARRVPGGGVVYLHGAGPHRVLRERNFIAGTDEVVHRETLTYHLTADVHPNARVITYSAPIDNAYYIGTQDLDDSRVAHRVTDGDRYAIAPAFSADGETIFFTELGENRQWRLMRIATYGGAPEPVAIERWDYGEQTGTLALRAVGANGEPVTARVAVAREDGHGIAFDSDATYFDPQTGRHYFYVEGSAQLKVPAGRYTVLAARGPMTPVARAEVRVRGDASAEAELSLAPLWDAAAAGYTSADHHVHLNGDGHSRADHDDALRLLAGEDLDLVAPMSWNRWERRIDAGVLGKVTARDGRIVAQGQEVRSHFHGHIGLLGVTAPFAPWFFGPPNPPYDNPTLGNPDLTNGDVLAFASDTGAFATYVHPLGSDEDPFDAEVPTGIPLELVSDSVLGERVGLELVCAWTSPLSNSALWYRLLNVGRPVAAMSGTDAWVDFHRTPAIGTGRNYLRLGGAALSANTIREAAIAGRGFVSTGPALLFQAGDGKRPGEVIEPGAQRWRATLASTVAVDVLEIIVNGAVVQRLDGVAAGETRTVDGEVTLPEGGWVAARAYASEPMDDAWPTMHRRPFAHSSPIWIGEIGSTAPAPRQAAAADLIRAIDASEARAREAYGAVDMPRLYARFEAARDTLRGMVE